LITLAHELRNPLAPLRTGLELMRIRPDAAGNGAIHAMMQRQVNHMAHLVDDLLDVARLTEGKVTLQRAPVLLADVVQDALEMSMPLITAGAHELTVALPDDALLLDADRHRIAQVLGNLVNNAAKYTPRRGRIHIDAQREDRLAPGVLIGVTDNGVGIAAAALEQVFDMYTQVHDSAAMAQGGLGVGLHLVRRLVELHGGAVAAASGGAGQGSRFTVWLPLGRHPVLRPRSRWRRQRRAWTCWWSTTMSMRPPCWPNCWARAGTGSAWPTMALQRCKAARSTCRRWSSSTSACPT
jgi:signal transduction histidine kinase